MTSDNAADEELPRTEASGAGTDTNDVIAGTFVMNSMSILFCC